MVLFLSEQSVSTEVLHFAGLWHPDSFERRSSPLRSICMVNILGEIVVFSC